MVSLLVKTGDQMRCQLYTLKDAVGKGTVPQLVKAQDKGPGLDSPWGSLENFQLT
jgi:hypothetical protein